jgi:branched-chain amino acid transport system substrate-binding protein
VVLGSGRIQIAVAFSVLALSGCRHEAPTPAATPPASQLEPVVSGPDDTGYSGRLRLASIFPSLGRYAISGQQSVKGARLAVDEINRRGGVQGRQLELLEYNTGSYFIDARHAAELAIQAQALALIGSNSSSLSMAVAEMAEAAGVVQISNVSTAQDLTWDPATGKNRRFVFRVCSSDVVIGARLAEFARDYLRAHRVAVLYEVGRVYSAKLARSFIDQFADEPAGRLVEELSYLPLETDFRTQLAAVGAFGADVLFVPGSSTDSTLIAIQAERMGIRPTLLGADGWSNPLLFARGGPSRPAYHADLCDPPATFVDRYRQAFGEEPSGCRAVLAHEAVTAVAAALQKLGPLSEADLRTSVSATRARLRDALQGERVRGEVGTIAFDEHGDCRRGVAIMEIWKGPGGGYRPHLYRWLGER